MNIAGSRILVLEDESIIAFGLEDMLEMEGARVHVATDLDEAEAVIHESEIDFAILDVNVRGKQSYDLANMLRERGTAFIFATGYGDAAHPAELVGTPTITKPYTIEHIRTAIALLD